MCIIARVGVPGRGGVRGGRLSVDLCPPMCGAANSNINKVLILCFRVGVFVRFRFFAFRDPRINHRRNLVRNRCIA